MRIASPAPAGTGLHPPCAPVASSAADLRIVPNTAEAFAPYGARKILKNLGNYPPYWRPAVEMRFCSSVEKASARAILARPSGKMVAYLENNSSLIGTTTSSFFVNGMAVQRDTRATPAPAATRAHAIEEFGVSMTAFGAAPSTEKASSI